MKRVIGAFLLLIFASWHAQAGLEVYDVSDAAGNCGAAGGPGGHGLWTRDLFDYDITCPDSSADIGNYFSVTEGQLFVDDMAGEGFLWFNAANAAGDTAEVAVELLDLTDPWTGSIKNPFGADVSTWDIFGTMIGSILINGTDFYTFGTVGSYGFQIGMGANDKNPGLGASGWLDVAGVSGNWDINLNITPVPAPASLALLGLGLMGLGIARKRRN